MLKRTWSIRRQQTYSLTRRVEPGAVMQREKGMIRCQVTLLDEDVFTCDMDVSRTCTNSCIQYSIIRGKDALAASVYYSWFQARF